MSVRKGCIRILGLSLLSPLVFAADVPGSQDLPTVARQVDSQIVDYRPAEEKERIYPMGAIRKISGQLRYEGQATARGQAQALGATPMAVIALASDVAALQKEFQLVAQPDQDGLQWVLASPVSKDATMQSMRLGLRVSSTGVQLARLEMADAMGQRSVLVFDQIETNPPGLGPSGFQFSPPAGVEVLRP